MGYRIDGTCRECMLWLENVNSPGIGVCRARLHSALAPVQTSGLVPRTMLEPASFYPPVSGKYPCCAEFSDRGNLRLTNAV